MSRLIRSNPVFTTTIQRQANVEGVERLNGVHHGRLAVEQTYGYMVHDNIAYGIISTFNGFVFIRRESPGILYMSRMIPNNSTTPTIIKLLYFFSYLCVRDHLPEPERNTDGTVMLLSSAQATTSSAAPKIPTPNPRRNPRNLCNRTPRRSPRHHVTPAVDSSESAPLCLDINTRANDAYLGCKGWRGTLNTGETVFVKVWDAWKSSSQHCKHEASIYFKLQDLWGSTVPEFRGMGKWAFCHILLLPYIEVNP
jgi:hypothetical protein